MIGIVLGMAMSRIPIVRWFFDPIVSVGFPMPKVAFLPVIILWLGVYDASKITMIVVDATFPVITATIIGIQGVDTISAVVRAQYGREQPRTALADRAAGRVAADHDRAAGGAADRADPGGRSPRW